MDQSGAHLIGRESRQLGSTIMGTTDTATVETSGTIAVERESWQHGSTTLSTTDTIHGGSTTLDNISTVHGGELAYNDLGNHGNVDPSDMASWKRGAKSQSTYTTNGPIQGGIHSNTTGTKHGGKMIYGILGDHGNVVPSENAPWKRGATSQSTHGTSRTTTTTGEQMFRNGSQLQIGDRVFFFITMMGIGTLMSISSWACTMTSSGRNTNTTYGDYTQGPAWYPAGQI